MWTNSDVPNLLTNRLFLLSSLPSTSGQQTGRVSAGVGGASGMTAATQNISATRGSKHSYDTDPGSKVPKWFKIGQFCVNTDHINLCVSIFCSSVETDGCIF